MKYKDWGYYDQNDGNCLRCKGQCSKDPNCGAVECGNGWCSWWKVGKCQNEEEFTGAVYTCRKGKDRRKIYWFTKGKI